MKTPESHPKTLNQCKKLVVAGGGTSARMKGARAPTDGFAPALKCKHFRHFPPTTVFWGIGVLFFGAADFPTHRVFNTLPFVSHNRGSARP